MLLYEPPATRLQYFTRTAGLLLIYFLALALAEHFEPLALALREVLVEWWR